MHGAINEIYMSCFTKFIANFIFMKFHSTFEFHRLATESLVFVVRFNDNKMS